jgi:L-methionine (R)-S-oxide reductase
LSGGERPSRPEALRRIAGRLSERRGEFTEAWISELERLSPAPTEEIRTYCLRTLGPLLERLADGDVERLIVDEAEAASEALPAGVSLRPLALGMRALLRASVRFLVEGASPEEEVAEEVGAMGELAIERLEVLLRALEEEGARRVIESQEQAARAAEQARELSLANEALKRSEAQSRHRAEQIELLGSVFRRIAGVLDPDALMQVAAETIQGRMNHTYVAVVVLDQDGVLVGRWAGRPGVGRRSSGRAQGSPRGIIGRALRKKAPQVVPDVSQDPDYHPDVPGTHSEMVIPLLDEGEAIGAIDFQTETPSAFDLDDVAVGETLADYLVVALGNARQFADLRGNDKPT